MKRRVVDLAFAVGGAGFSVLLLVLGLVLTGQANFANDYIRDELVTQKIVFPEVEALKADEQDKPCLVKFAGQPLDTGRKAECYANSFIALHMERAASALTISDGTNFAGATYATLGSNTMRPLNAAVATAQGELAAATAASGDPAVADAWSAHERAVEVSVDPVVLAATKEVVGASGDEQLAAARASLTKAAAGSWDTRVASAAAGLLTAQARSSDPQVIAALQAVDTAQADAKAVTSLRSTLQTGETLRGLLLTTYGFSIFGDRAEKAALVCFFAFALLMALSILGFLHAAFTHPARQFSLRVLKSTRSTRSTRRSGSTKTAESVHPPESPESPESSPRP